MKSLSGALLIRKHQDISSYGVVDVLKRQFTDVRELHEKREIPKIGHGGTLDPFATGLLVVLIGRACKLARYFLGATKSYSGVIRFGETTIPGDATAEISERSDTLPESLTTLQEIAKNLTKQVYLQTPPMHSAKKHKGKPLYKLARAGIEIDRAPKLCQLYQFEIEAYENKRAQFKLVCSSGTYVRTLAQDFARLAGTVGLLESLERTGSGHFDISNAYSLEQIESGLVEGKFWNELPCWVPFDQLLQGFRQVEITDIEAQSILNGRQADLPNIMRRSAADPTAPLLDLEPRSSNHDRAKQEVEKSYLALVRSKKLVAVATTGSKGWKLDTVFNQRER